MRAAMGSQSGLVVFDFDGTLADTWRDIASALNRTLRQAGLSTVEGPDVRFWIGDGARKLLERAVPEAPPRDVDALYNEFLVHYESGCLETTRPYEGVIECLDQLADLSLVVASNKPSRLLDRVIGGLGLDGYFDLVLGGDALPVRKPDPGVLRHVLDVLPAPRFDAIWMVGDSAVDVATGRAVDASTIGCTWGLRGREELLRAGADFLVEKADDIPRLILPG